MNNVAIAIIIVAIVVIVAIALAVYSRRNRTQRLRAKFGSEYDRVVAEHRGDRMRAENILQKRLNRTRKFHIRPLTAAETNRLAAEWRSIQELFVDDPRAALSLADTLVNEALTTRGYPTGHFEQRVTDLSVEHPHAVQDYRIAHEIAARGRNETSTEDLREAMQHYRTVFEDILQIHVARREEEVHQ
jgi:hypothetical protein